MIDLVFESGRCHGASPAELFRRRRRGAALPPGGGSAAHLTAAAQPADPSAGDRDRLHPARAHPPARGADCRPARRFCTTPVVVLAELEGAIATAQRIGSGQTGRLRVNFVGSALLSIVPGAVQRFRSARPNVEIQIRERPTVEQVRAVIAGHRRRRSGPAPVRRAGRATRRGRPARADGGGAAQRPSADRLRRVPLRRLAAEPLVLFPRSQAPGFHDLLISSLAATGINPSVFQYAPEMTTIVGLVAAGMGFSLVPASVARLGPGRRELPAGGGRSPLGADRDHAGR